MESIYTMIVDSDMLKYLQEKESDTKVIVLDVITFDNEAYYIGVMCNSPSLIFYAGMQYGIECSRKTIKEDNITTKH